MIRQSQMLLSKSITFTVSLVIGTRMAFILENQMMRSFSQLLLLEFVRILKLENKNSLVARKSLRMRINTCQIILSTKMISRHWILLVENLETLLQLESVAKCQQCMCGIL